MEERDLKRAPDLTERGWPDDEYSADLGRDKEVDAGDTTEQTRPLGHHEAAAARERLGEQADEISVLRPGTRLHQGGTYVDLDRLDAGPFTAYGGQRVEEDQLVVSKKDIGYDT